MLVENMFSLEQPCRPLLALKDKDSILSESDIAEFEEPPIYNYVSQPQNPTTWEEFSKHNGMEGTKIPSTKCIWYFSLGLHGNYYVNEFLVWFLHLLPAVIVDTFLRVTGRKPM